MTDTEDAWEAVLSVLSLLPDWVASRPTYHVEVHRWHATAFYAGHLRRLTPRPTVEAEGTTEIEALRELTAALTTLGPLTRCVRRSD